MLIEALFVDNPGLQNADHTVSERKDDRYETRLPWPVEAIKDVSAVPVSLLRIRFVSWFSQDHDAV